ncbi:MAG: agmatine deiminase family protein, partial [Gammaproteobacteria bacterium]|nr:agmatine deiminase family protein [Gammaproteobacteria bacterium]
MPPEWFPHQSTWISWPHNRDTWHGNLGAVERVMAEAVRA